MKVKRIIFVAVLCLLAVGTAVGMMSRASSGGSGTWKYLGSGTDSRGHFVVDFDQSSVSDAKGGLKSFVLRTASDEPIHIINYIVQSTLSTHLLNCQTRAVKTVRIRTIGTDGKILQDFDPKEDWETAKPKTPTGMVYGILCEH